MIFIDIWYFWQGLCSKPKIMNIFKELFWALNLNQYCIWIWFYILNIWNIISDNSEIIYVPLDNPIVQYKNIQRNVVTVFTFVGI